MSCQQHSNEQLALFKSIFEQVSDAVYIIDPETSNIVNVNQAGCDDVGMSRDEVLHHSVFTLQRDVLDIVHWREIVGAIREAGTFVFVGRHIRKDGTEFPVEVHSNFFVHEGHELLVSIARDISERVSLENQIKQREPQLSFALNIATDGLWDWNIEMEEVFFSPQLKRMLGYGPREMSPHISTWKSNVHADDVEHVMAALSAHLQDSSARYEAEYRLRNRNGEYIWVHDHGCVCERNEKDEPIRAVGMVRNINKFKELEAKLQKLAAYDELTGLLNRRAGYEQFKQCLVNAQRQKRELSIALFDIDHFKRANDHCGHLVGDDLLRKAAHSLKNTVRQSDVLLRWGGEEFLLLMPDTSKAEAYALCDRLRNEFEQFTSQFDDPNCQVTLSGGVASYPEHGNDIEQLVALADTAMYRAKEQRNKIVTSA